MSWILNKVKSLSLGIRIITITLVVVVAVVVVNNVVFVREHRAAQTESMIEKAAAFTAVADEAKNHTAVLQTDGDFNTEELLAELAENRQASAEAGEEFDYTQTRIFKTIPVVAGMYSARDAAQSEGIDFQITSTDARNPENEPDAQQGDEDFDQRGPFTSEMYADLTSQIDGGGEWTLARLDESTNTLHYMRGIKLSEDCMLCHGHPSTSPNGDGTDVLGFQMENWSAGDMHGAYHVMLPMTPVDEGVAATLGQVMMYIVPVIIGAVVFYIFAMRVMFSRPVGSLIERIKDIAQGEGDLTQRVDVKSNDEIGQLGTWFNAFVVKIHDVMVDVGSTSDEVAAAATEIAASSEQIAAGMEEQSNQMTQISAAVEEMSASVTEVAHKSVEASSQSEQAKEHAEVGGEVVKSTVEDMNSISQAVSESSSAVESLGKQSEAIGQVTDVINEIAEQTNLLALNAAIEAARAGEHGRGFAVVADEVRKLADRTTQATSEIASSINSIRDATTDTVKLMATGSERVSAGVDRAAAAGQSLTTIYDSVSNVVGVISSIAAAAEEQSATSTEVAKNVDQVAHVIRQTKDGTGQAAAAATELSRQAESLRNLISQFKTDSTSRSDNS